MFETLLDRLVGARDLAADRRGPEPREAVAWPATLEVDGQRHPVEIGNISSGGLMARVDVAVPADARLTVCIDGERLTGEVRWHDDRRFGMRFDQPLPLQSPVIERYRSAAVEATKAMSRWMV